MTKEGDGRKRAIKGILKGKRFDYGFKSTPKPDASGAGKSEQQPKESPPVHADPHDQWDLFDPPQKADKTCSWCGGTGCKECRGNDAEP